MIPDGTREMSAAEESDANPIVENRTKSETSMTATGTAECREDEVQTTEEKRRDDAKQENSESGREETAEKDVSHQHCLTSSEISPSSEAGDGDSNKNVGNVTSSHLITDDEMNLSSQEHEAEKASEDDRQPANADEDKTKTTDGYADTGTVTKGDSFHHDTVSELLNTETNADVTAEEEAPRFGHGMFKHLLDSDTADYDGKMGKSEAEQKHSVEQDDLNCSKQLVQQINTEKANGSEMSAENADKHGAESNENAVEESANREVEAAEDMAEESRHEDESRETISEETTVAAENDKESVRQEETEQQPEGVPEQTSKLLQSTEECTTETEIDADSQPERDALTSEIPSVGAETVQQGIHCTTGGKSDELFEQRTENVEPQFLVHNKTVDQCAAEETEEHEAASTDACEINTFENPVVADKSDKNAELGAESAEEQAGQPLETSTDKNEVDSIQSAPSQPSGTTASVEQAEKASLQQTNWNVDQDHWTNINETTNEQPDKSSIENTGTEQQVEITENTEQNEIEVTEVDDKERRLTENSEYDTSELIDEAESAHQAQDHANDKEDIEIERLTATGDNLNEIDRNTERTTDKVTDEYDVECDKAVEETANQPVHADEVCSNNATNVTGQHSDNAPNDGYDEPDKTVQSTIEQRTTEQSHEASETKQDEPSEEDKVCAQQDGDSGQATQEEPAEDDEDAQEQASITSETSETMPEQANVTEVQKEDVTAKMHPFERSAGEEMTATDEVVESAASRNSAENDEQQIEEAAEINCYLAITGNSDEPNDAVATDNELATDISKETDEIAGSSEKVENPLESENQLDKSLAGNNETCKATERDIENSESTEVAHLRRRETTDESQTEHSTYMYMYEAGTAQAEDKSSSDKEATENLDRNDTNVPDAENPNEHHETEFSTSEFEQSSDICKTAEDNAHSTAVETCDRNTTDANSDHMVETDTEIRRSDAERENSVTESVTEANVEHHNISYDNAEKHDDNFACEHNDIDDTVQDGQCQPNEDKLSREDEVNGNDNETTEKEKAEQSIAEQYDTTGTDAEARQTETTQPVEVTATCNETVESNNDSIMAASDEVLEARETDEVLRQDPDVIVNDQSEEILNRQDEDDEEPTQLINRHDSPVLVKKHESIRSYVDDCRDIELSGVKLDADQVGRMRIIFCAL